MYLYYYYYFYVYRVVPFTYCVLFFLVHYILSRVVTEVTKIKHMTTMKEAILAVDEPMLVAALQTMASYCLTNIEDNPGKGAIIYVKLILLHYALHFFISCKLFQKILDKTKRSFHVRVTR